LVKCREKGVVEKDKIDVYNKKKKDLTKKARKVR
jgi:hypothetical protein